MGKGTLKRWFIPSASFLVTVFTYSQTAILTGKVAEAGNSNVLVGVTVRLSMVGDTSFVRGTFTDARGEYTIKDLPAGEYKVSFTSVGYRAILDQSVTLAAGDSTRLDIALDPEPVYLDAVVVSASRKPEKALDAPASVTYLDPRQVAERPAITAADHL